MPLHTSEVIPGDFIYRGVFYRIKRDGTMLAITSKKPTTSPGLSGLGDVNTDVVDPPAMNRPGEQPTGINVQWMPGHATPLMIDPYGVRYFSFHEPYQKGAITVVELDKEAAITQQFVNGTLTRVEVGVNTDPKTFKRILTIDVAASQGAMGAAGPGGALPASAYPPITFDMGHIGSRSSVSYSVPMQVMGQYIQQKVTLPIVVKPPWTITTGGLVQGVTDWTSKSTDDLFGKIIEGSVIAGLTFGFGSFAAAAYTSATAATASAVSTASTASANLAPSILTSGVPTEALTGSVVQANIVPSLLVSAPAASSVSVLQLAKDAVSNLTGSGNTATAASALPGSASTSIATGVTPVAVTAPTASSGIVSSIFGTGTVGSAVNTLVSVVPAATSAVKAFYMLHAQSAAQVAQASGVPQEQIGYDAASNQFYDTLTGQILGSGPDKTAANGGPVDVSPWYSKIGVPGMIALAGFAFEILKG